jgi:hypothetical protein
LETAQIKLLDRCWDCKNSTREGMQKDNGKIASSKYSGRQENWEKHVEIIHINRLPKTTLHCKPTGS